MFLPAPFVPGCGCWPCKEMMIVTVMRPYKNFMALILINDYEETYHHLIIYSWYNCFNTSGQWTNLYRAGYSATGNGYRKANAIQSDPERYEDRLYAVNTGL